MHQEFKQLLKMWPQFACYFVTFSMLGFVWFVHHRMYSSMKYSDSVSMWLNIICMMFACLLPFSTSLLAKYMGQQLPILIYEGNYFMIALLGYVSWLYATGKYRLVDTGISLSEVRLRKIMFLSGMVYAAIGVGVSYFNTVASMTIFVVGLISSIIYVTLRTRVRTTERVAE